MPQKEQLEIRILENGEVRVDVIGSKGKKCEQYIELFRQIIGDIRDSEKKPEYYEQDAQARIDIREQ